jgi:hypothetical protein
MPVSPATQSEVDVTMRTAPVVVLTQAETLLDVGAAMAAVPAKSKAADNTRNFREDIGTSGEKW